MRILVADDEARLAELIAAALTADAHAVAVAYDGRSALGLATASPFDLILLDVMLPELDGFTVCRRLREQRLQCAVLMLTARGAVEDRVLGLDAGADDYLVKPFAMAELKARIRALARRPKGIRGPELQVGDLVVSPLRYEASRAGHRLELTTREFQLLSLLIRHAGEVVSRSEILDTMWGEAAEPYGNVVDQYIYYLRVKTEAYGPRLIDTVRGVGYMLRESDSACSDPSV